MSFHRLVATTKNSVEVPSLRLIFCRSERPRFSEQQKRQVSLRRQHLIDVYLLSFWIEFSFCYQTIAQ